MELGVAGARRRSDLLRRWPVVLACVVLAAGAALAASLAQTEQYTASASLLFRDPGLDESGSGASSLQAQDPEREAATNLSLVSLQVVADRTAQKLGTGLSGDEINGKVAIVSVGRSDVVEINATDSDPARAAQIANVFARRYIAFRRQADRSTVRRARVLVAEDFRRLSPAERATNAGESLAREISRLKAVEALQTGNAELVQTAEPPTDPSSPKTARNVVLGALFGLAVGAALAFAGTRFDRRLREPHEFEQALELPLLATIPSSKEVAEEQEIGALYHEHPQAFQMLRTRLRYFNVDRDVRTVLVTSAASSDGKTTVAWNLALAAASAGVSTAFVEADFHRSQIAMRTGLAPLPGLSELLSGQSELTGTLQRTDVGRGSDRSVDIIVAGSLPPNPDELLESREMSRLLERLTATYDLVVIDTPPISRVADAIPLIGLTDGVIVVGRLGRTTHDEAIHLAEQLSELNAAVLGVVVNGAPVRGRYGAYGYYGVGYGQRLGGSDGKQPETVRGPV
jgi:capsular exopolysaccharide synthesis family protein